MNTELRNKILASAISKIGVKEFPANSNIVEFNDWFYGKGKYNKDAAWCGTFVSWNFYTNNASLGNIGYTKGFAGCQTAIVKVAKWGRIVTKPEPGDVVFYDWQGDGKFDHTAIFEKHIGDGLFSAIEGNTSFTNDSNGGEVMRRERKYKQAIFVRPNVYKD